MAFDTWWSLLNTFVQYQNELNIEYEFNPVHLDIRDAEYCAHQLRRLSRIRQQHQARQIEPVKHEVRANLVAADESNDAVNVRLKCRNKLTYRMEDKEHDDCQVYEQQIVLMKEDQGWVIERAECPTPEKTKTYLSTAQSCQMLNGDGPSLSTYSAIRAQGAQSQPLINAHVFNGMNTLQPRSHQYDRMKAQAYADKWWDSANPGFIHFDVDCTNYVSQCLYAGGAPMHYTGRRESGWWYKGRKQGKEWWSYSWSVAHSLRVFLDNNHQGLRAHEVKEASQLDIGDVIVYDWDGDGSFQHSVIVAAKDHQGMPLVNAHTTNSYHRYWDYKDSYAWSERTVYRFFHILDVM